MVLNPVTWKYMSECVYGVESCYVEVHECVCVCVCGVESCYVEVHECVCVWC